ncbi:MAG: TlpA disulfide reductase family protein, partial [Pseudomonadota bacterium]
MWQALYEEVNSDDFIIVAVAEESRGLETAQEFIDEASPTFVCLIDKNHIVADLYNMVNVPNSVWIDENGKIVRPAETTGSHDAWRSMNREDMSMTDDVTKLIASAQKTYMDAVKDWALNGANSKHAFDDAAAKAHLKLPSKEIALAHANFRLGVHLMQQGDTAEGDEFLKTASVLHPDSWNMYRQAMNLREIGEMGFAADVVKNKIAKLNERECEISQIPKIVDDLAKCGTIMVYV